MSKVLAFLFALIIVTGCGNTSKSTKAIAENIGTGTESKNPISESTSVAAIPQDSEVSITTTSAVIIGSNGKYTLTYTDTQSALKTSVPLLYEEVYQNQIIVIYQGGLPSGVTFQSDLEGTVKIGLFTSNAVSPDGYAADLVRLNALPGILLAEPNYTVSTGEVITAYYVNDPNYPYQWGLQKVGIETAWGKTTGKQEIVVAVIDTGIDYTHEDLAANIWYNTDEIEDYGIDQAVPVVIDTVIFNFIGVIPNVGR